MSLRVNLYQSCNWIREGVSACENMSSRWSLQTCWTPIPSLSCPRPFGGSQDSTKTYRARGQRRVGKYPIHNLHRWIPRLVLTMHNDSTLARPPSLRPLFLRYCTNLLAKMKIWISILMQILDATPHAHPTWLQSDRIGVSDSRLRSKTHGEFRHE